MPYAVSQTAKIIKSSSVDHLGDAIGFGFDAFFNCLPIRLIPAVEFESYAHFIV